MGMVEYQREFLSFNISIINETSYYATSFIYQISLVAKGVKEDECSESCR